MLRCAQQLRLDLCCGELLAYHPVRLAIYEPVGIEPLAHPLDLLPRGRAEETRKKMSESRKGKPPTKSQAAHYQSMIGIKASNETKAKQSAARKAYWTNRHASLDLMPRTP
jgi:hypothetical protein